MTLQEAKDKIAKKYGLKKLPYPNLPIYKMCDEVAELYAQSKLDEKNKITQSVCAKCLGKGYYEYGYSSLVKTKVPCECGARSELTPSTIEVKNKFNT